MRETRAANVKPSGYWQAEQAKNSAMQEVVRHESTNGDRMTIKKSSDTRRGWNNSTSTKKNHNFKVSTYKWSQTRVRCKDGVLAAVEWIAGGVSVKLVLKHSVGTFKKPCGILLVSNIIFWNFDCMPNLKKHVLYDPLLKVAGILGKEGFF